MTLTEIANTFTDQPTIVGSVRLPKWGMFGRIVGLYRRQILSIAGLPLGKVQLIAATFNDMMGAVQIDGVPESDQINLLLQNNLPQLVKVIGMAVCKSSKMPTATLIQAINDQLTMPELAEAISEVYRRLDLTTFFGIMALTKSLNLNDTPDQEAPGQPSLTPLSLPKDGQNTN